MIHAGSPFQHFECAARQISQTVLNQDQDIIRCTRFQQMVHLDHPGLAGLARDKHLVVEQILHILLDIEWVTLRFFKAKLCQSIAGWPGISQD